MKNRQDFVSNSSSSSFIMPDNEKDSFYSHLGHSYKLFKLTTIKNEFIKLKQKIESAKSEFLSQTGLDEYIFQSLFDTSYYQLSNCIESLDDNIKEINDAFKYYEDKDCLISEPVDRDRAYQLGYEQAIFKGDL